MNAALASIVGRDIAEKIAEIARLELLLELCEQELAEVGDSDEDRRDELLVDARWYRARIRQLGGSHV